MQENFGNELLMVCVPLGEPHMKPQLLGWGDCQTSRTARSRAKWWPLKASSARLEWHKVHDFHEVS